ncbi:MAG: hypothetical protein JWQ04_926, partial [Pedosphaera sp.]|nr:hypothetical protein [Pedosphaera sp.]
MIEFNAPVPLPEQFRQALGLESDASPPEALTLAEDRLKDILEKQQKLPERHPSQPKLKKDLQKLEPIVAELRELVFGLKVDELCDSAEAALVEKPAKRAVARDFLKRARLEGKALAADGVYIQRIQKLEARVEAEPEAVLAASVTLVQPPPSPLPATIAPPPPENPFLHLEVVIDKGMVCLVQDLPDQAAAGKHYAEAEKEAAGKKVPDNLRSRMQLFKRTLDQVRREAIHVQVDQALNQVDAALAREPSDIAAAREQLRQATALLQQAPDPYFQRERDGVERTIEEHEQRLTHRESELAAGECLAETRSRPALLPAARAGRPFIEVFPTQTRSPIPEREAEPPKVQPVVRPVIIPAPAATVARISSVPKLESNVGAPPPPAPPAPVPVLPSPNSVQPPFIPETAPEETPEQPPVLVRTTKHAGPLEVIAIILLLGLIGIAYAGYRVINAMSERQSANNYSPTNQIAKPPPIPAVAQPDMGELSVSVMPAGAELFTNGVSLGHPGYPVRLQGVSGKEVVLEAALTDYSNVTKSVSFPGPGSPLGESLELQPKPALLLVRSEPSAAELILRKDREQPLAVTRSGEGIELTPGVPVEVSLEIPDYETVSRKVAALKPGERQVIDFGALRLQPAGLHLKVDPSDARFFLVYAGRDPIPLGQVTNIENIIPRMAFNLVAERPGYAAESNGFLLNPHEVRDYDFGRLKPLPATVVVTASPQPFDLKVSWDGASKNYGPAGRAAGLPPGKNLIIALSAADHEPASTNLVLEPGETRELNFGSLQPVKVTLLLKSDPPNADVIYSVDDHFPVLAGVTDHINGLPLGHAVEVTLHKAGYVDRAMSRKLSFAGDSLDFGHLTPLRVALAVTGPNDGAEIYLDDSATKVKNGGTLTNLVAGKSYTIRLRKP